MTDHLQILQNKLAEARNIGDRASAVLTAARSAGKWEPDALELANRKFRDCLGEYRKLFENCFKIITNGRRIIRGDYESISSLARANSRQVEDFWSRIELNESGQVVRAHFSHMKLGDLAPLSNLTRLQQLELAGCFLTNIKPLSALTGLQILNLSCNLLTDISALSGLTGLKELALSHNELTDIAVLSALTELRHLELRSNRFTDVTPLSGLTRLQELSLVGNNLTNINSLSGLIGLQRLYLGRTGLSDISVLSDLIHLQTVSLDENEIIDIGVLSGLHKLQLVFLSGTPLNNRAQEIIATLKDRGAMVYV